VTNTSLAGFFNVRWTKTVKYYPSLSH